VPSPLPPANSWNDVAGCLVSANPPSIVSGIVINGVPAIISSVYWQISLNDGSGNFQINQLDGAGNLVGTSMQASGVDGSVTFNEPVYLSGAPTVSNGAATKAYADAVPPGEAPLNTGFIYARGGGTWVQLPTPIPDAPNTSQVFGRYNSTWQLIAIQTDAPSDGNTYGRLNGGWNQALATTGGTITGNLTVNQVLTVQGSNSLVLNAPVGNQRSILGMTSTIARWGLTLGDGTTEGLNNVGSNFTLAAYSTTGAFLGNWLTIARADGSTTFNGSGVTINGGLSVNGLLALASPNNLAIYGGSAGQFLATDGTGILSWQTPPGAGGGIGEAPDDGTMYARINSTWENILHTDIADWATALSGYYPTSNPSGYQTAGQVSVSITTALTPYALSSSVPVASTTTPSMNGTAAVGTGTTWARGDHVHPSDTSRYAASNPSGYQTAAQVSAALTPYALTTSLPPASTVLPIIDGTAAIGVSTAYARADHVHPAAAASGGDTNDIVYFGDGSDGAVSITTAVTLTRDMFYSNLTISGAGVLNTMGFRVFVSGILDITAAAANAIVGATLTNATVGSNSGGLGGVSAPSQLGWAGIGTSGNAGGSGANQTGTGASGQNGGAPPAVQGYYLGSLGGQGGSGGVATSGTNTGGAGGNISNSIPYVGRLRTLMAAPIGPGIGGSGFQGRYTGGSGGGGGGGGGTQGTTAPGGGGGGYPGAFLLLFARTINRGAATAVGAIFAGGGPGANGGAVNGASGASGGGGGGGGGCIYLVYRFLTGASAPNVLNASGASGGNSSGSGVQAGTGGFGGTGGNVTICNVAADTIVNAVGSAGSAPSGITGGAGGPCLVTL
jgi:hypothetical protein